MLADDDPSDSVNRETRSTVPVAVKVEVFTVLIVLVKNRICLAPFVCTSEVDYWYRFARVDEIYYTRCMLEIGSSNPQLVMCI